MEDQQGAREPPLRGWRVGLVATPSRRAWREGISLVGSIYAQAGINTCLNGSYGSM
jgi:hypothetical protein